MTALTPEQERSDVIKPYDAVARLTLAPTLHPPLVPIHS